MRVHAAAFVDIPGWGILLRITGNLIKTFRLRWSAVCEMHRTVKIGELGS